jgi:hypothetical protein
MHVHRLQSETLTVQSGRIGVSIAGEPDRLAEAGETAGVPHRFWNAGDTEFVVTGEASRRSTSSGSCPPCTPRALPPAAAPARSTAPT